MTIACPCCRASNETATCRRCRADLSLLAAIEVRRAYLLDAARAELARGDDARPMIEEAAALWESLAMNHGSIDGNKRVAFACTMTFLDVNGLVIEGDEDETIAFIYGHFEAGTFRKDVLDAWLRAHSPAI